MPTLTRRHPKYRKHKPSGQAVVTLNGFDYYLGPYGTKASRSQYDRRIKEWLEGGKHAPGRDDGTTINALVLAFMEHAVAYYRKPDGTPTSEVSNTRDAVRPLVEMYGGDDARKFGPLRLKAVRSKMIEQGWCRRNINRHVNRLRHMFKWAVENEM